jgi:carboxymethylenebutenolidase
MRRSIGRLLGVPLLALLLAAGAGGSDHEAHVDAMAKEHASDAPVASPASQTAPRLPVHEEEIVYATLAGHEVLGFLARPSSGGTAPGILVIHEWWGLNDNIRAMTRRLAGEGYVALAVDLYEGGVAEERDEARRLMQAALARPERILDNLRAAHRFLAQEQGAPRTGSIGWCFGGGWSLQAALALPGELDASVMYYGRVESDPARLAALETPLLGLFGGEDRGIPVEGVRTFERELAALGKPAEIRIYEGADHAFANPSGTRYQPEAAEDAWRRTLEFFRAHLLASPDS